jgi:fructose-1,6-bisphosphatase/inositol monophosphatase family enzyme
MLTARACRSVDAAGGQLIAREAGALVEFEGLQLAEAPLGLDARYRVAAGLDREGLELMLAAQAPAG